MITHILKLSIRYVLLIQRQTFTGLELLLLLTLNFEPLNPEPVNAYAKETIRIYI